MKKSSEECDAGIDGGCGACVKCDPLWWMKKERDECAAELEKSTAALNAAADAIERLKDAIERLKKERDEARDACADARALIRDELQYAAQDEQGPDCCPVCYALRPLVDVDDGPLHNPGCALYALLEQLGAVWRIHEAP